MTKCSPFVRQWYNKYTKKFNERGHIYAQRSAEKSKGGHKAALCPHRLYPILYRFDKLKIAELRQIDYIFLQCFKHLFGFG